MAEDLQRIIRLDVNATQALAQLDKISKATGAMERSTQSAATSLQKVGGAVEQAMNFGKGLIAFEVIKTAIGGVIDGFMRMSEAMDQVGKTASGLGITTEEFTKLQYAADLAGVNTEQLTSGLSRLNDKIADVGKGTDKASQLLRHFGVEAGDSTQQAMEKIADAFARSADGPAKTAAAIELFGRMLGLKMIPLLNGGAAGLKEMGAEAQKFGLVLGNEAAKKAEEFNDNLRRLELRFTALGRSITSDLLPQMNELLKNVLDQINKFGLLKGAVLGLWETIKRPPSDNAVGELLFNTKELESAETRLVAIRAQGNVTAIARQEKYIAGLKETNTALNESARLAKRADDAQKTVIGTLSAPKVVGAGKTIDDFKAVEKAAKATKSEMDKWFEGLLKAGEASANVNVQIQRLEVEMKKLEAAGKAGGHQWQVFNDALVKLRDVTDPAAIAIAKIAETARTLEESPKTLDRMIERMDALARAGLQTSEQYRLLREEVLKVQAVTDPFARITLDVEKLGKESEFAAAHFEALLLMFGRGEINTEQFTELARKLEISGKSAEDTTKKVKSLSESVLEAGAKFVTDFGDKLIDSFGKADKSLGDFVESAIKQFAKLMLNSYFAKFLKMVEGQAGQEGFWGSLGTLLKGAAHGAAFTDKGIQYMAAGGIVSQPTMFAHGGGLGVMGEAGAEAIVPLRRDAAGDLGVKASPTIVNVHNNNDSQVSVSERTNTDGMKEIDIMIERKVRSMVAGGKLDTTMRSSYGLSRQPSIG